MAEIEQMLPHERPEHARAFDRSTALARESKLGEAALLASASERATGTRAGEAVSE
jgi:hypothetical protein